MPLSAHTPSSCHGRARKTGILPALGLDSWLRAAHRVPLSHPDPVSLAPKMQRPSLIFPGSAGVAEARIWLGGRAHADGWLDLALACPGWIRWWEGRTVQTSQGLHRKAGDIPWPPGDISVGRHTHKHQIAPRTPEKLRLKKICFPPSLQCEPLHFIAVGTAVSYTVIAPHVVSVPFEGNHSNPHRPLEGP